MNHLILWKELTLFIGSNPKAISGHQHPIIQLVIGVNEPFVWKNEEGKWVPRRSLLVAPNTKHECDAQGKMIFTLGIEPESLLGEWINENYLHDNPLVELPDEVLSKFDFASINTHIKEENWSKIYNSILTLVNFKPDYVNTTKTDTRISAVKSHIETHIHSLIDTKGLMEVAHLSESRLLHLFKQEMGLPIRNYILWFRIKVAFLNIIKGNSLTEAAYHAGFSDQAHLSRTFVKTVGISPSVIVKNSKFVQVSFPN